MSWCVCGACQTKLPGGVLSTIGVVGQTRASSPVGLIRAQSANDDTRPHR